MALDRPRASQPCKGVHACRHIYCRKTLCLQACTPNRVGTLLVYPRPSQTVLLCMAYIAQWRSCFLSSSASTHQMLCIPLQMVCSRCPATADMAFASDAVASGSQQGPSGTIQGQGTCSNCHLPWTASLKPRLVHAHSNVLASIKTEGCHPLDLLPSLMGAQCGNCSAAASLR